MATFRSSAESQIWKKEMTKQKHKPSAPVSEARSQLAALIAQRAELVTKVDSLHSSARKLESQFGLAAPFEAELSALDASETSAFTEWSQSGAGTAPKPNVKQRNKLSDSIASARAASNAARSAQAAILADHAAVSQRIHELQLPIECAIAGIVTESCDSLIADFDADNRKLAAKRVRLTQALDVVLGTLDTVRGTDPGRPVSFNMEDLHGKLKTLFGPQPIDDDAAAQSRLAWRSFSDALRVDANAQLVTTAAKPAKAAKDTAPAISIAEIAVKRLEALARLGA
jgi:hypothetical protein